MISFQFSHSVVSDSLQPHEPQHARPPCPSPTPGVHPNPCPLSRWCHPTTSSSVVPFFSCSQSFLASGSFQMSQLFASCGQSIRVSASTSVLPRNTQDLISFRMDWCCLPSQWDTGERKLTRSEKYPVHFFCSLKYEYDSWGSSSHFGLGSNLEDGSHILGWWIQKMRILDPLWPGAVVPALGYLYPDCLYPGEKYSFSVCLLQPNLIPADIPCAWPHSSLYYFSWHLSQMYLRK